MKKALFIIIPIALTILILGLLGLKRSYVWDMAISDKDTSEDPMGMLYFDKAMEKSLPKGYSLDTLPVIKEISYDCNIDSLVFSTFRNSFQANDSCNYLIVQGHTWIAADGEMIDVLPTLHALAEDGATIMYVMQDGSLRRFIDLYLNRLDVPETFTVETYDYGVSGEYKPYSKEWFAHRMQKPLGAVTLTDTVTLDFRYSINYFNANRGQEKKYDPRYFGCTYSPYMWSTRSKRLVYVIELDFPESGGHLYLCSSGLYMCNLGLDIPGGDKVIECIMDAIDDREIKRVQYSEVRPSINANSSESDNSLRVLLKNPSLALAWHLVILFICLLLARGLMRRHPASARSDNEALDKTDLMAVREYKFRKSPLLHFLYQCSWLYSHKHNSIFLPNYRRVARAFKKLTALELTSATDAQIALAAERFAFQQQRDASEIREELIWMRNMKKDYDLDPNLCAVTAADFARSQMIAEKYKF